MKQTFCGCWANGRGILWLLGELKRHFMATGLAEEAFVAAGLAKGIFLWLLG
jgi:hypothetical protein